MPEFGRYDIYMRSRVLSFAILIGASALMLPGVTHAAIPFFGPIIPSGAYSICPGGWGLLITVINRIIEFMITIVIVFITPLMIAYGGFLYVVNPTNPGNRQKANQIIFSTVIGIAVSLSGWLVVDAIMAVLYNPGTSPETWSSLIRSNGTDLCINQLGTNPGDNFNFAKTTPVIPTTGGLNNPPRDMTGTACDPAVVRQGAAYGGYVLSDAEANTFACIAKPESQCGKILLNYNWNGAKSLPASTAAGAFQVLLATNHTCYENQVCYAAAGVSGPLNCQTGFNGDGTLKTDAASVTKIEQCKNAAANLNCSVTAAACLLRANNGSFRPWQADYNNAVQTGCITNGGF